MSGTAPLPLVLTSAGAQPTPPADLNAQLIAQATALMPDLTANLPGSLIEDIASTATGALIVNDQARVEFVNSITPYGANPFLLNQLGQIYGVPIGTGANTSVFVVFSGPPGFVMAQGFVVSDGTYQYILQDGGVIGSGGTTQPLSALATQSGSWSISPNTVTQLVTSVPTAITPAITVTNPLAGTPAVSPPTQEVYRSLVLQAGLVTAQGTPSFIKTLINQVNGVAANLVSLRQQTGGGWEVIVGGSGDPYLIGFAILQGIGDVSILVGSTMQVTGLTNANPGVVTTSINHGFSTGQVIQINGATGVTGINAINFTITVLSQTTFSIGINTSTLGTYTGNGIVTPNFRNVTVNIYDYPDVYTVQFVVPPAQTVTMVVTWNTSSTGFVSPATVASAANPALVQYVNALPVGQPMNLYELQATFQGAVANLVPLALLTRMVFAVSINGIGVVPSAGTGIFQGDPESYFTTTSAGIVINQG